MSRRTIAAAAALLAAPASPAGAGSAPAAWVPTLVHGSTFYYDADAFPDGTGLVTADAPRTNTQDASPRPAVFRTTDGGRTWERAPEVPAETRRVAFGTQTGWWGLAGQGRRGDMTTLTRTRDAGATWSRVPLPTRLSGVRDVTAAPDGTVAVVGRVKVTGGPSCFGDGPDEIAWSTDGGATWTEYEFPPVHSGNGAWVGRVEAADARTGVALVFGDLPDCYGNDRSDLDVYLTRDGGVSWSRVARSTTDGRKVKDANVNAAGLLSVGWSDGTVSVSEDDGATFHDVTLRRYDSERFRGLDSAYAPAFTGRTGYVTQLSGAVWRSTDGGTTWAPDGQGAPGTPVPFDADRALLVGLAAVQTRVTP